MYAISSQLWVIFFLVHDLQHHKLCSRHNSKVWCEMIFPMPLISSSTEKAMHVCCTAFFPPTKYPESSLNIPMLYSRTVGSLSIPSFINNILIECFYHSPHSVGEGMETFLEGYCWRTFSCICFSVIKFLLLCGATCTYFNMGRESLQSLGQISNDHRLLRVFRSYALRKVFLLTNFLRIANMLYTFDFC